MKNENAKNESNENEPQKKNTKENEEFYVADYSLVNKFLRIDDIAYYKNIVDNHIPFETTKHPNKDFHNILKFANEYVAYVAKVEGFAKDDDAYIRNVETDLLMALILIAIKTMSEEELCFGYLCDILRLFINIYLAHESTSNSLTILKVIDEYDIPNGRAFIKECYSNSYLGKVMKSILKDSTVNPLALMMLVDKLLPLECLEILDNQFPVTTDEDAEVKAGIDIVEDLVKLVKNSCYTKQEGCLTISENKEDKHKGRLELCPDCNPSFPCTEDCMAYMMHCIREEGLLHCNDDDDDDDDEDNDGDGEDEEDDGEDEEDESENT